MISAQELVNAVIDKLRLMPAVVEAVNGDAMRIRALSSHAVRSQLEALEEQEPTSIAVQYVGAAMGHRGEIPAWRHQFAIYPFIETLPDILDPIMSQLETIRRIVDGPVDSLTFINAQLHPACDPPDNISIESFVVNGFERWSLRFELAEAGG